jgi:hypothetical protein
MRAGRPASAEDRCVGRGLAQVQASTRPSRPRKQVFGELEREENEEGVVLYRRRYDGRPHREDGPAAEVPAGVTYEGLFPFHRTVEGPAQLWMRFGLLDRPDGPALESADGVGESYARGYRHADGRPAVTIPAGVVWKPRDRLRPVPGPA